MNRFLLYLQALANLFASKNCGKRVLFHMALLGRGIASVAHFRLQESTRGCWTRFSPPAQGTALGIFACVSRRQLPPFDDFCPGHQPYITSCLIRQLNDRGVPYLDAPAKRRRTRTSARSTQYTRYPDDRSGHHPSFSTAAAPANFGQALAAKRWCIRPGFGLSV